jgi:hypothetical protein
MRSAPIGHARSAFGLLASSNLRKRKTKGRATRSSTARTPQSLSRVKNSTSEYFPNSEFSIIEIFGEAGNAIDIFVRTQGKKLALERVIAAKLKHRVEITQHLEIVRALLDRGEHSLPLHKRLAGNPPCRRRLLALARSALVAYA